ncbi:hypothetical protein EDD18DRAFT_1064895, partial [Armillaria luteobubalina]
MEEVRKDMQQCILPLALHPAPLDWGTPRRGKLSADQWKMVCSIHLPITLVRLWGVSVGRHRAMLENFLNMVKAIDTTHNREISASHIDSYDHHAFRYLKTARVLYKDFKMKPIHHVSLHLGEFMRRMGPVHSYRVPAFERLNFLMQRENTNMKSGKL